jgi:hypothetical protein
MTFGLNNALRVFTQIMKKCVMAIREIWRIRCVIYLDDLVLLHPDRKTSPTNYSIPDSKPRKISPSTDSTVPIPRMDMELYDNDSSITSRQTSENIKGIKNCEEKNLQKENDFCKNSCNFDWDAFRYKNTISQDASLYLKRLSTILYTRVYKEVWDT